MQIFDNLTSKIREDIISFLPSDYNFNRNKWITEIKRVYLSSADGVGFLQDKLGWYNENEYETIMKKWNEIVFVLKECPSFSETLAMISEIGLSYNDFIKFYGLKKIDDAIFYAKDLKDRYSVLWLNYKYFNKNS